MCAQCKKELCAFHALGRREVVARFDGGRISSRAALEVRPNDRNRVQIRLALSAARPTNTSCAPCAPPTTRPNRNPIDQTVC
jgi:hypothetical protein